MATQRIYSAEEAVTRLHQLPPTAQEFIYSKDMGDILTKIGEKYALHLDQLGNLEHEAVSFMLGFTEPVDFTAYIAESVEVPPDKAANIAKDVNDLLLSKIRQDMKATIPQEHSPVVEGPEIASNPSLPVSEPTPHTILPSSVDTTLSNSTTQMLPKNDLSSTQELTPPQQPPASSYKTDPYREPIE